MTTRSISGFALALLLAGVGCGGGTAEPTGAESQSEESGGEGEHGHGEHGHAHGDLPPTLEQFHSVLAPVWHSEPGAGRAALACEKANDLSQAADVITTGAMPEGVDSAGWQSSTGALSTSVQDLRTDCESGGAAAEAKLSAVHDAFHAVMEQVRGEH